jgi:hypothetical protein
MQLVGELILAAIPLHGRGTNFDIYINRWQWYDGAAYLVADAPCGNNIHNNTTITYS